MYTEFFGLSEMPFSIAPNPNFLYMSERHQEALAHLTYGLGETGGFVLLTGEVGTGKTTVSRRLLQQLPENTQAAFILNPALSNLELLASILDQLKVRYRKTSATLKSLTDKIQQKLLKNHEAGINTVLIIDEAQHLKAEVLEQLRLLTNLETDTKKLLQIILIGQPELQQLLQRRDLRQLAQRITARYHLLPLSLNEVKHYIQHRLAVANCHNAIFSDSAIREIHRISKGIPRIINLLCDRAMLGAYGLNQLQISPKFIKQAAQETLGLDETPKPNHRTLKLAIMAVLVTLAVVFGYFTGQKQLGVVAGEQAQMPISENQLPFQPDISTNNLPNAVNTLLSYWQLDYQQLAEKPCELAQQFDLACYWYKGNLSELIKLHYPAVVKLFQDDGSIVYGVISGTNNSDIAITFAEQTITVSKTWFDQHWRGGALIFWQAPKWQNQWVTELNKHSNLALWQWLENRLSLAQHRPERKLVAVDNRLLNQLQQYQVQHHLIPVKEQQVEQLTLMMLANDYLQGMPMFSNNVE